MIQIQAGSSVESQCGKCKTVTDHHVVAMDGDQVAKVECKVILMPFNSLSAMI